MVQYIRSHDPDAVNLPFSQAVWVGNVLYLSGQLGTKPGTIELVPGGIEAEARQTMENIGIILDANGLAFADVFKCTAMLADMKDWAAFNTIYLRHFEPDRLPVRTAFGVRGLALGATVELECIACRPTGELDLTALPARKPAPPIRT